MVYFSKLDLKSQSLILLIQLENVSHSKFDPKISCYNLLEKYYELNTFLYIGSIYNQNNGIMNLVHLNII